LSNLHIPRNLEFCYLFARNAFMTMEDRSQEPEGRKQKAEGKKQKARRAKWLQANCTSRRTREDGDEAVLPRTRVA
jgi:hypothetical protein